MMVARRPRFRRLRFHRLSLAGRWPLVEFSHKQDPKLTCLRNATAPSQWSPLPRASYFVAELEGWWRRRALAVNPIRSQIALDPTIRRMSVTAVTKSVA